MLIKKKSKGITIGSYINKKSVFKNLKINIKNFFIKMRHFYITIVIDNIEKHVNYFLSE